MPRSGIRASPATLNNSESRRVAREKMGGDGQLQSLGSGSMGGKQLSRTHGGGRPAHPETRDQRPEMGLRNGSNGGWIVQTRADTTSGTNTTFFGQRDMKMLPVSVALPGSCAFPPGQDSFSAGWPPYLRGSPSACVERPHSQYRPFFPRKRGLG